MFAIIDIAGYQFKVKEKDKIKVPNLNKNVGDKIIISDVLMLDNDGKITYGTPKIEHSSVEATVLRNEKDEKVLVFKKKRRKGYRRFKGHRQDFTELFIEKIN